MIKLTKTKTSLIVTLVCIFTLATLLTAFLFTPKDTVNAFDTEDTDITANAVVVPQLWDDTTQSFNSTNFQTLLNYISSDGTIENVNTSRQTAADIRNYTYGGKESGKSVVVTLGNYQWQVVYLTRIGDTTGDRIATLLMVDNDEEATFSNGGYDDSSNWSGPYPTSMYSTSYIHVAILNNGGTYADASSAGTNPTSTITYTQSSSHKYALYTMSNSILTNYLVQPKNVWYQTQSQGNTNNGRGYVLNNESLATNLSGYYRNRTYQTNSRYTEWGDDYLWLPSLSEAGTTDGAGIWELSTTERASSSTWWSRSSSYNSSNGVPALSSSGISYTSYYVSGSLGVRPALHLNIDSAINSFAEYIINTQSNNLNYGIVSEGGTYFVGISVTLTATPNTSYFFDYWQDNSGIRYYSNPLIIQVIKNETYTAYFKPNLVTITSSNKGSEISSSESEITSTCYTYTLTFTQNNYISGITINSGVMQDITATSGTLATDDSCILIMYGTNATGSRLYLNVIGAVSEVVINLHFVDIAQSYTPASGGTSITGVALQVSGGSGSTFEAVGEARITGYSQAENITYVHVSAVPSSGYYFVGWQTSDDTDLTDYGSSADIPYNLIEGKILTAVFAPNPSNSQTNSTTDNTGTEIG